MSTLRPPADVRPAVLARVGVASSDHLTLADVDVDGGTVALRYHLDGVGMLSEVFDYDGLDVASVADTPAVAGALRLLHVAASVSYLKTLVPPRIVAPDGLRPATLAVLAGLVGPGLGEFAYVNEIDLRGHFTLPPAVTATVAPATRSVTLDRGPLVPVGGGKDSIVTLEALRALEPTLFAVNPRGPIERTIETSGLPAVTVQRRLDDRLFELNDAGALNGHVPVTAIVSAAAVVAAVVAGHDAVAMSNEASADEPTLTVDGWPVNHQWSKSSAFERVLATAVRRDVHPDLDYLSFLRPASELAIARRFAATTAYDDAMNSCNRAFHLHGTTTEWCGDCPKCRFVALVLAPFVTPERMQRIMGRDVLDDPTQTSGVADLAGLGDDHKPFECVGEELESRAALACLSSRPGWRDKAVIRALADRVTPGCEELEARLRAGSAEALPARFRTPFREAFG